MSTHQASAAPTAVRITTVIAVVVVAAVAAVVSYSHMTELAHSAGEEWRSWLIPISVDGLIVAASMVLLTRHRAGLPGGWLAWGSLSVGVVASLAANMADARPEVTSVLVAGWAPVAFAATFHLLLQQRRADRVAPLISDPDRTELCSGSLSAAGSDLHSQTHNAPLGGHSGGRPAERAATVLPGADRPAATNGATAGVPECDKTATSGATTQAPRRDKPRDKTATSGATRRATNPRQVEQSTAEQRRVWVRQQRDNGRTVTGADVHEQFPDAPRDGSRIVRQVAAELDEELRAVAAGER